MTAENRKMIRTYPLKHRINTGKQKTILKIAKEYRKVAGKLAKSQWKEFFLHRDFNKNLAIKEVKTLLSERYKQCCQYQVVGILDSFIGNRQNDFVEIACKSNLPEDTKVHLLFINKYRLWFAKSVTMPAFNDGKKIEGKVVEIPKDTIELASTIFKHVLKKHRRPRFSRCNMALDNKVAKIDQRTQSCRKKAKTFDYWITLSTLEPYQTIALPLITNRYFEEKVGVQKKFCQINIDEKQRITVCLIKDVEKTNYVPQTPKIALDFGLRNLFATDTGDLYGRDFLSVLMKYDRYITSLAQNRQRQKFPIKSPTYDRLVSHVQNFLKNEINRVINRIVQVYNPREIVVEKLNFTSPDLSRTMNRILSNMGRKIIRDTFSSLNEEFKIIITSVPASYSSQECSLCGYVDKKNRNGVNFQCRHCHHKMHADVNGSCNLFHRSSMEDLSNPYLGKSQVLDILIRRFLVLYPDFPTSAPDLVSENPYFKKYFPVGQNQTLQAG